MKTKRKIKPLSEDEIDQIVIAQANDEAAWDRPVRVRKSKSASVALPAELAARAAFFARLHRQATVEDWLQQIIRERLDLEEAALAGVKRELVKVAS
jgi:hypothetical protein